MTRRSAPSSITKARTRLVLVSESSFSASCSAAWSQPRSIWPLVFGGEIAGGSAAGFLQQRQVQQMMFVEGHRHPERLFLVRIESAAGLVQLNRCREVCGELVRLALQITSPYEDCCA
jgi:hypothetical protein